MAKNTIIIDNATDADILANLRQMNKQDRRAKRERDRIKDRSESAYNRIFRRDRIYG